MTLVTLSVPEAIALACREVPECWPEYRDYHDPATGWKYPERLCIALFFDEAYEWLLEKNIGEPTRIAMDAQERFGVWNESTFAGSSWTGNWTETDIEDPMPTKWHALIRLVLLAAGKEVP